MTLINRFNHHFFKKILLLITLTLLGFSTTPTWATEKVQVDRYLNVPNHPTLEQANLLAQQIYIRFSRHNRTVGAAVDQLLKPTGYRLAKDHSDPTVHSLLQRPLPSVHQELGPMPLQDALITLSGNTFQLLVDPVHRLVSFKLKNIYSGDYQLNALQRS